jgi:cytochrome c
MKRTASLPAIIVTAALVLGVGMVVWKVVAPPTNAALGSVNLPVLSNIASAGKDAFDANCASCHGVNGAGSDQGPPLIHDIYNPGHHDDASFFRAAMRGVPRHHWTFGDMPPQPEVTREEIAAIVRYIREVQQANGIFWKAHVM